MGKEAGQRITGNVNQGANVQRLHQVPGIKQETLAAKSGINQAGVSRLESRRVIENDTSLKIANILNVSPKIIQELQGNPRPVVGGLAPPSYPTLLSTCRMKSRGTPGMTVLKL